jgi:hypothetical protein
VSRAAQQGSIATRDKAANDGHAPRPLAAMGETAVKERTETTSAGTVKVITAKGDLTGRQELRMAADQGEPVGQARCTQRVRFANAADAHVLPSVLLCWRVSAQRSVVTFTVSKKGRPSPRISESIINGEWAKL